jgi:acylphosphatase
MATAHWIVVGKVQGVGFRWFVREQARRWGVRGWVRNRPDGSVEIAASGAEESLEGLLAAVRRGPDGAAVADVQPGAGPPEDLPEPFSILRG